MRAIRILKEADLVLAEDTRTSSVLLKHFDIRNRLVAHHKFNEHGTSSAIVERLKGGETIALISDAGTLDQFYTVVIVSVYECCMSCSLPEDPFRIRDLICHSLCN